MTNIADTLTIILIAYATIITILLAVACERNGLLKQRAEAAEVELGEAKAEISDDNVIITWMRRQIGGHIRDNFILVHKQRGEKSQECELAPLVTADVMRDVEAFLAQQGPLDTRELEAQWPSLPDLPGGVDRFEARYGKATGSE